MTEWDAHFRNNPRSLKTTQDVQIPGFFPGIWDSLGRELQVVATSTFGCYTSLCVVLFEDAAQTMSNLELSPSICDESHDSLGKAICGRLMGCPLNQWIQNQKNRTLLMDDVEFVGAWLFNVLQIPPK